MEASFLTKPVIFLSIISYKLFMSNCNINLIKFNEFKPCRGLKVGLKKKRRSERSDCTFYSEDESFENELPFVRGF